VASSSGAQDENMSYLSKNKPRDGIGEYYERKAREAESAHAALADAKRRNAGHEEITRLRARLEDARNTGD
jgi:hypothetical protein